MSRNNFIFLHSGCSDYHQMLTKVLKSVYTFFYFCKGKAVPFLMCFDFVNSSHLILIKRDAPL